MYSPVKHIYIISGFGADDRVFKKLDFGENETHFIPWKIPGKNETIASYAIRMQEEISHPNPVLAGLSFGGMMSIEIAKMIPVEKIILISSIKSFHEIPFYMRLAATSRLNKLIPLRPYKFLERIENYNLGAETDEEKTLLREYRKNINQQYTTWAIDQILNWKNEWQPQNIVHIHGGRDHIFPVKYVKPDFIIPDGGHFMVMNRADELNGILRRIENQT